MPARGHPIRTPVFFLLFLTLTPGLCAQEPPGAELPVHEHTLANGLRLFILPRPGAPTVSFVVQYRIGSVNEGLGETGTAHFLEHLFFKGTTSVGTENPSRELPLFREMDVLQDSILALEGGAPTDTAHILALRGRIRELEEAASEFVKSNEFDAILSTNGARSLNATTSAEATTYFVELPSNRAQLWFPLEADRIVNPVFREFFTERDVVAEERRMRTETNPAGMLYEAHLASAFHAHPYGRPVVGYMHDIQRLTRPGVEAFFREYYGPNNAVLAVVGDVDPEQILEWAREYLEPIPAGREAPLVREKEPEQRGERRVEVVFDAEPILRIGWKVPPATHEDTPALDMLTSILTGGRPSRLYRRLVREDRSASSVVSSIGPGQLYPRLFTVEAYPRSPFSAAQVEEAVYQELERLMESPPDEQELQRVRNQLEAAEVRRLRSNLGLAFQIAGSASLLGDWRETFSYPRLIREVTPEDVQRVVRRYFTREGRTVATLVKPASEGEGGGP